MYSLKRLKLYIGPHSGDGWSRAWHSATCLNGERKRVSEQRGLTRCGQKCQWTTASGLLLSLTQTGKPGGREKRYFWLLSREPHRPREVHFQALGLWSDWLYCGSRQQNQSVLFVVGRDHWPSGPKYTHSTAVYLLFSEPYTVEAIVKLTIALFTIHPANHLSS